MEGGRGMRKKRPGPSKDSVPMAASFQNSLGMKNNEKHRGEQSCPGKRVLTSGLAESPSLQLPEGTWRPGDLPLPHTVVFFSKVVSNVGTLKDPLLRFQCKGATFNLHLMGGPRKWRNARD